MKKTMRKAIGLLCAAALLISSFGVMPAAFADTINLATGATAIVLSSQSGNNPANINDGKPGTTWRSGATMGDSSAEESNAMPWFGLEWEDGVTFDTIRVLHDNKGHTAAGYSLYLAFEKGVWTKQMETTDYGYGVTRSAKDYPIETFTFAEPQKVYGIKIVQFQYADSTNKRIAIQEVYVENSKSAPVTNYDTAKVDAMLAKINAAFAAENTYGYTAATWDAFTQARATATTAAAACSGQEVESGEGYLAYTQEQFDALATDLIQKAQALKFETKPANVLSRGLLFWDEAAVNNSSGIKMDVLTDGNELRNVPAKQSNWQGGNNKYFFLQLTEPAKFNQMIIYSDAGNTNYDIYYVTDCNGASSYAEFDALGDAWQKIDTAVDYEIRRDESKGVEPRWHIIKMNDSTDVEIAALKIVTKNGDAVQEVAAFCGTDTDNCFTATQQFTDDDGNVFFATNVTERALSGKGLQATYTLTQDDTVVNGTIDITDAYAMVALGKWYVTSADIPGGRAGDYVAGVLFTDIPEGAKVSNVKFQVIG